LNSVFRGRASLGLELIALPHQLAVSRPQRRRRPRLSSSLDRLLWVWHARLGDWSPVSHLRPLVLRPVCLDLSNSIIALRVELRNTDAIELGLMN
jgi:hypothetical protein